MITPGQKKQVFALTAPLITMADGKKMGKSEGGAVWLNPDMLPPYDYWQVLPSPLNPKP